MGGRVAITGAGALCAVADSPARLHAELCAGRSGLSVAGILAAALILVVAIAVLPRHDHRSSTPESTESDHTPAVAASLAAAMAKPLPALQQADGHFQSALGGGSRYGDALVGYALLQHGLRTRSTAFEESGLRGVSYALSRSAPTTRPPKVGSRSATPV